MRLIYEGKEITNNVDINNAVIIDAAGGQADSLEIRFSDTQKLWSSWRPEKNQRIELSRDGFKSGIMYVDSWEQVPGYFILQALSVPQEAKTAYYRSWEDVQFLELVQEIAGRYKLDLHTQGIQNYLYKRVEQKNQTDIQFLSGRCKLEGYALKITNNTLVIFNESAMEKEPPAAVLDSGDFDGEYQFWDNSIGVFSACQIIYGSVKAETKDMTLYGPVRKITDIPVSSIGEAQRFSAGILRSLNKSHAGGSCRIRFNPGIAAGNMIEIQNIGLADGKYYCEKVVHNLVAERTKLYLRRPMEGY